MGAWGVDSAINSYGADYVMKDIKRVLKPADVAFFNAEGPYSNTGTAATWKDVYFRGNPRLVPAMAKAGVDVVTMANNHCLDYGSAALLDSIRRFNANDIEVVGAGKNYSAAWKMRFVERDGVKVGFMGWTDIMPPGFAATKTGAGAAVGPTWSGSANVSKSIRAAAKKVDILVASYHWGIEGQHYPIGQQIQEAHAAIDAGADLVMSHHPHYLQGIERYHGGLIMYSFGDLVFPPRSRPAAETVIMTNVVSDRWIKTTITPYLLDSNGVPHRATGSDASSILSQLNSYSKARGTAITIDTAHQRATVKVKRRL
jgi:poly-gamma-glutamate synthesis protein (capsule biosynthesis protein)